MNNYASFPVVLMIFETIILLKVYSAKNFLNQIESYKGFIQRQSILLSIIILLSVIPISKSVGRVVVYLMLLMLFYIYSSLRPFETENELCKKFDLIKYIRVVFSVSLFCLVMNTSIYLKVLAFLLVIAFYALMNKVMPKLKVTSNINFSFKLIAVSFLVVVLILSLNWIGL